ncbi:hypothetical protein HDC92_003361 [Pedobacter sp. AK017]|uniref:RagB/SusD family nutrient uptake outer membrane protein n=1 Tax=Pedobacter sp. AK017 TaxID=2723073 RepID=UPI0016113B76|nr:RagB/SusD family nutrient uptake outer membrane protein [Pedobacter sp. AK017]MBB5439665.1 hypothetical protein [Pedobacter sp. AK017]
MKRILYTLLILSCFSLTACKKFLSTKPTDSLVESDYYTKPKLINALAGVYQPLGTPGLYGDNLFDQMAASDENFYARAAQTTGIMVYNFDFGNAELNNFWVQLYIGIERANILIRNVERAKLNDTDSQAMLGEALFLRGYYHFMLVSNFGDVPLKTEPTPSVTQVNTPRTATRLVYEQILTDMKAAEPLVKTATALGFGGRVSKTTVQGIIARVYLTMAGFPLKDEAKYEDVLLWAEKVKNSGEHSLNLSYRQLFINLHQDLYDTKESMWEIEQKGTGADGYGNINRLGNTNGIALSANYDKIGYSYAFINATAKLFNLYSPGDIRRDWAIAPFSYNASTTPVSYSYFNPTQIYNRNSGKFRREYELSPVKSKNFTPINFPVLRYADVLLMIAEAENHINGPTLKAYDAINQVRRRGFGYDPNIPVQTAGVLSKLTLSTAGNTGYLATQPNIPITLIGGGGTGATGIATVNLTSKKITSVAILNPGKGYTSVPQVIIGNVWAANTEYTSGTQVSSGNNLYTVTASGTSTTTAPTHTAGASLPALTGAVFTYAGQRATATAEITSAVVDLSGLTKTSFLKELQDERSRELCFEALRRPDLIRWGIWVPTMNNLATDMKATAGSFAYGAIAGANITDRNVLFPIPSSEILVNGAIGQNLGW